MKKQNIDAFIENSIMNYCWDGRPSQPLNEIQIGVDDSPKVSSNNILQTDIQNMYFDDFITSNSFTNATNLNEILQDIQNSLGLDEVKSRRLLFWAGTYDTKAPDAEEMFKLYRKANSSLKNPSLFNHCVENIFKWIYEKYGLHNEAPIPQPKYTNTQINQQQTQTQSDNQNNAGQQTNNQPSSANNQSFEEFMLQNNVCSLEEFKRALSITGKRFNCDNVTAQKYLCDYCCSVSKKTGNLNLGGTDSENTEKAIHDGSLSREDNNFLLKLKTSFSSKIIVSGKQLPSSFIFNPVQDDQPTKKAATRRNKVPKTDDTQSNNKQNNTNK